MSMGPTPAVVGHGDEHRLSVGDRLCGDLRTGGQAVLQNVSSEENFLAHNQLVDCSSRDAHTFVRQEAPGAPPETPQ